MGRSQDLAGAGELVHSQGWVEVRDEVAVGDWDRIRD